MSNEVNAQDLVDALAAQRNVAMDAAAMAAAQAAALKRENAALQSRIEELEKKHGRPDQ